VDRSWDIDMPYWLFSHTHTTGRSHTPARLRASWNDPSLAAPSPKKHTTTLPVPCIFWLRAAPAAMVIEPATMPLAPRLPCDTSAMCIDPPRPRQ
jgi:hypothetical protein